jgi:hypothetical protein
MANPAMVNALRRVDDVLLNMRISPSPGKVKALDPVLDPPSRHLASFARLAGMNNPERVAGIRDGRLCRDRVNDFVVRSNPL